MEDNGKVAEYIYELQSYANILNDYMDAHEEIEEFLHASLIVNKMQENINKLSELV